MGIENERHVKIATEAGLIGGLIANGINTELAIISDDAGQFNILGFLHGLCWMHSVGLVLSITSRIFYD